MSRTSGSPGDKLPPAVARALELARDLTEPGSGDNDGVPHDPGSAWPETDPRRLDEALRAGWLVAAGPASATSAPVGPLAGLDVAVKDVIDVAGLPVRNGTPGGLWRTPRTSAPAWQRLSDAGARCIGKAATHEMAWGVTTPQIGHPQDPDRFVGGSSGGSASCVAAAVCPAGLGTDTSGSLRIPAALCGVVGFRPTTGSIDTAGVTPLAPSQDTVGPIAADVHTCVRVLEVLVGRPLGFDPDAGISGLHIGVLRSGDLDEETQSAYSAAARRLSGLGATVIDVDTRLHRWADSVSYLTMLLESAQVHSEAVLQDPNGFGREARELLTRGRALAAHADVIGNARRTLTIRSAGLFSRLKLDAVVTPATACVAPLRSSTSVRLGSRDVPVPAALTRFTSWASVTGMPAISTPVASTGLPVGLQVMAPPWREDVCVRVASAVESHHDRRSAV